ncbi:hypothetical protein BJV82DRAFT_495127, partial [Fennellomyces sp. T-0311]
MDKTLSDYDQSLEELERQREHLELVMKKMGQEWEESGAGIGWMGSLEISVTPLSPESCSPDEVEPKPLLNLMQQHPTGPSPDYLQSLLNVNEALLAQSLIAKPTESAHP